MTYSFKLQLTLKKVLCSKFFDVRLRFPVVNSPHTLKIRSAYASDAVKSGIYAADKTWKNFRLFVFQLQLRYRYCISVSITLPFFQVFPLLLLLALTYLIYFR